MNTHKNLKPNLVDPMVERKIIKTLKPVQPDYWAPTRNIFQNIYYKYIKNNIGLIIFIIIIILFLIYRYRFVKKDRQIRETELYMQNPSAYHATKEYNSKSNPDSKPNSEELVDAEYLMQYYNLQKEKSREPVFKTNKKNTSGMAYPMYPYGGTKGSLIPSGKR